MKALIAEFPDGGLDGDRVLLRRPRSSDRPAVLEACRDPDILRFTRVPDPYEAEDADQWAVMSAAAFETGIALHLVIADPADQVLYGGVGLVDVDPEGRFELGLWVAPEHRGGGYAQEASRVLAGWVFGVLPDARLYAEIAPENEPSLVMARRLGFRPMDGASAEGWTRFELSSGDLPSAGPA